MDEYEEMGDIVRGVVSVFFVETIAFVIPLIGLNILALSDSAITFATTLLTVGYLLFSYICGLMADRWNRKLMMVGFLVGEMILVGVMGTLIYQGECQVGAYFGFVFITSFILVTCDMTFEAWVPDLFQASDLATVNQLTQNVRSIASLCGPLLAGVVLSLVHEAVLLFLLMVILLICVLIVSKFPSGITQKQKSGLASKQSRPFLKSTSLIFKHPVLKSIVLTTGSINFSMTLYSSIVVLFLVKELQLNEALTGTILSLSAVGAILGAIFSSFFIKKWGLLKAMIYAPIIPSCGMLLMVISVPHGRLLLFIVGSLLIYFARSVGSVARQTVLQTILPSEIRGEVNGVMRTLTWGMIPLGSLCASVLTVFLPISTIVTLAGCLLIGANLWNLALKNEPTELTQWQLDIQGE